MNVIITDQSLWYQTSANILKRLYSFLEKEQLLFEGQFRFRNNQSTTDALIDITERIRNACDKGLYACGAFLDFKKAFDTVNHDIIFSKLVHYGIRGQANNWFHSYIKIFLLVCSVFIIL